MARVEKIIPNLYRDSVALMQLSSRIANRPGIDRATAVMATQANISLLKEAALLDTEIPPRPNDLLIIIEGADAEAMNSAMRELQLALQQTQELPAGETGIAPIAPSSLQMALEDMPDANLALISTPGEYAAAEAEKALRLGLNVMLFSANVEIDDEIALKKRARDDGLLMMGPDCGTAIINGIPLAFANVVRRGAIGLVASAGTGLQEVTTLIHRAGIGISQALGCGGRDLSEDVGGISMRQGLSALASDAATEAIVLIAKHPSLTVAGQIREAAARAGKPVVINFLGIDMARPPDGDVYVAETLEDAAQYAVMLARAERPSRMRKRRASELTRLAQKEASHLSPQQKYVRGLFSGGTFCYEAQMLLSQSLGTVWSNTPIDPANALPDLWRSREHTLIDLGDDVFTRGRPHPMIDQRLRIERIAQEFNDPETAVILLDVVLGYGAHPDPGSALAGTIAKARQGRNGAVFVASVCGTEGDPQNLTKQQTALQKAGVLLAPSNAAAARLAADIVLAAQKTAERV
jgi:succinyl-CoA synthetase alpha subunit